MNIERQQLLYAEMKRGNIEAVVKECAIFCVKESRTVALMFHKENAGLDVQDKMKMSPLAYAAKWGRSILVSELLKYGADFNICASDDRTPLMISAINGRERAIQEMLKFKPLLDLQDTHGKTALIYAAEYGHFDCVKILVVAGADTVLEDHGGYTAAGRCGTEAIRIVLHGARNKLEEKQKTAARKRSHQQSLRRLVRSR